MLCKTPRRLNSVDVLWTSDKPIIFMIYPKLLINTDVNQTVIASSSIGVNDAVGVHFPSNYEVQRWFGSVWNNFRVNTEPSFEKAKNDSLSTSPSASFVSDSFGSKVGLIGFNFNAKWRLSHTKFKHSMLNFLKDFIGASHRHTIQLSGFSCDQIKGKMANNLSKFGSTDFRTALIPIFLNHFKELTYFKNMFAS